MSWIDYAFGGIRRFVLFSLTALIVVYTLYTKQIHDKVWDIVMLVFTFYFALSASRESQDREREREDQVKKAELATAAIEKKADDVITRIDRHAKKSKC